MRRPLNNTTKLPKLLKDELGVEDGSSPTRGKQGSGSNRNGGGRKERRRAEREQKKSSRYAPRTAQARPAGPRPEYRGVDADEAEEVALSRRQTRPQLAAEVGTDKPKSILKKTEKPAREPAREYLPSPSPPPRISKGQRDRLAQDEAEIAALEKKLGMKGKKKLPKAFEDDGLDSLLEGLDGDEDNDKGDASGKRKRTEAEDWLEAKRKKARRVPQNLLEEDESDSHENGDLSDDFEGLAESLSGASLGEDDDDSESEDFEGFDADASVPTPPAKRKRENPYVAPSTTSDATLPTKYIPPSLRAAAAEDDALPRLRRQIQGLLNRLSEANLLSILSDVEQLYRTFSRQNVASSLMEILLGLVCNHASLTDTFLILHAGFIAAIYKIIGTDFGAMLIQQAVERLDRYDSESSDGKESNNLISLLSELYNFQVVGSNLIFDFIRSFLDDLTEQNTELLLKIIKNSGPQLRQDDPSALKDIVLMLQPAITKLGEANLSVRTKFMIETINNLKNNRMKTGIAASTLTSESTVRMKKILGSLNTRNLRGGEPLRIGLNDIRNTDKRGKWWLVGASWKGENEENAMKADTAGSVDDAPPDSMDIVEDDTADLIRLAKEQRMNTDIRRAIFISVMSAEDYRDAEVRLTKLRLKKAQELEIPRVLIHCSGAEQVYNPYYTLIARRLCGEHKLKMAFQFSLWDLFKRMGEGGTNADVGTSFDDEEEDDEREDELGMRKMVNLAKMYGTLIADGGLGLNVLKNINLAYLQPKSHTFVELLFITIILQTQQHAKGGRSEKPLMNLFLRVKDNPGMTRGLQYFLKKVVSRTMVAGGKAETATVRWGCKVAGDALAAVASSKVTGEA